MPKQAELIKSEPAPIVAHEATHVGDGSLMQVIANAARDPNVDVQKMQQLLEMSERMQAKQAEIAFNQALSRLQPRLPRIKKNGRIEFGTGDRKQSTPFARYEDISSAVKPLLAQEGFTVSFGTEMLEKGGIIVTCNLSHREGHSKAGSIPLPFDTSGSKNSIQAVGSTITYGKRYLLCAILDIVTENEDTDGASLEPIDQQQVSNIINMCDACEMDAVAREKFLKYARVGAIEEIRKTDYARIMNALQNKLNQMRGAK